ncbi:hypothetical protein PENFLA_c040G06735 [Penicillium flavigenum]|uniref:Carrier domain-containing protein n=1 Tax=Penicillium flavigenum TaxID=254877 RepID=A0A1V6SK94_9EURO|nr:hypothetical protein PENFLA_c040G06735 [Penicillium flavigenum]
MEAILVQQANLSPIATVLVDGDRIFSYRELILRADVLVDLLEKQSLAVEKPVCILVNMGIPQVLAQVAVLRAGGTCVPIDPAAPADRLKGMMEDLATTHLITSKDFDVFIPNLNFIPIEAALEAQIKMDEDQEIPMRAGHPDTHRSHIMFTSGSTGRPKPIQVLSSSILHALKNLPSGSLGPSDRMTALLNPGFDLSLLEIWKPLLDGATVVRVPHLIRSDPFELQDFVKQQRITFMIVPTALFQAIALTAPAAFCGVRHVIVGGEAVSCNAMRTVLEASPPENLWNGYGPAEATIYVTMVRMNQEEVQHSRISIGRTFGDTKVFLLNDNMELITEPGQTGEIFIAGPQVSPGYLNRPEENEKSFISVDSVMLGISSDTPTRMYRTGDLAQWRGKEGGLLDYIGRADDQVKVSGYRVELGEVSRTIETHPQVHSCVARYHRKDEVEFLEAYVISADWTQHLDSSKLIDWAKEKLPPYMVPRKLFKKRTFPLSANGKVDREALQPGHDDNKSTEEDIPYSDLNKAENTSKGDDGSRGDLAKWLTSVLQEMLPSSDTKPSDNIFSLGLSSLQAAQLIGRVRRDQGKTITLRQVHSHPTISSLADFLGNWSGEDSSEFSDLEKWKHDSKSLYDSILLPDWQDADEGRVFLTGATGFLGAHVLQQLLSLPTVQQVACLVRGQPGLSASARIQQTLERYNIWDSRLERTQKITVLEGDLTDINLGLGEKQFTWLTNWASAIFHVGARVNWCEPYEPHYKPNVVGTRNIIRAAMLGHRKALHYISSIDVWSVSGFINKVDRVHEDEPLMPHLNAVPYDTGYSASQFVAEELVQRARARGLPAAIYRPGFIIGHSENAIANANDYFSRLIMGSIQIGHFPDLATQYLEYVTVDYVTSAILHIASDMENLGRAYHIVPPDRTQSVDYNQVHQILRDLEYPVEKVDYKEWVEKVRHSPGTALEAMMPLLEEPVYKDMTRLQTSKDTPIYDPTNTGVALRDRPDIKYIALNSTLLQQFIQNWVDRGEFTLEGHRSSYLGVKEKNKEVTRK